MLEIIRITKIPKLITEDWEKKLVRSVYRLDNSISAAKYIVIEQQNVFGIRYLYFYSSKEDDCQSLLIMKVDNDPTYNCQLGLLGGIEYLIDLFQDYEEFYKVFKLISDVTIGKNMILVDVENDYVEFLANTGLKFQESLPFTSTNDSERSFILIKKPV